MASRPGKIPTTSVLLRTSLFSIFSTRRIETPSRYHVATTAASARPARRRCSRNDGKYDPARSFGIAGSVVLARVSHSLSR